MRPDAPSAPATTSPEADGFWEVTRGELEFQWDAEAEKLHVLYKPTKPLEYIDVSTGKSVIRNYAGDKNAGDIYHWISTPEHWIEFGENIRLGQLPGFPEVSSVSYSGGRVAKRRVRSAANRFTRVVEATDFFSNGSKPFWEECQRYVDGLRGDDVQQAIEYVEKNVSLIQRDTDGKTEFVLTNRYPRRGVDPKDFPSIVTIFDSSAGFQPVSWTKTIRKGNWDKRTFKYRNISGVYLPERYHHEAHRPTGADSALPTITRTFVLKTTTLNRPIPAGRFGIESLDLKYGERFLDEIENQLYVVDDRGLVAVDKFALDPARAPAPLYTGHNASSDDTGRSWTLIAVNVAVVAGLVVAIWLNRRRGCSAI